MGFALWVDGDTACCAGAHEYRPMGVAIIAITDLFAARDFQPLLRPPSRGNRQFRGLFASLEAVNHYMAQQRSQRRNSAQAFHRGSTRLTSIL